MSPKCPAPPLETACMRARPAVRLLSWRLRMVDVHGSLADRHTHSCCLLRTCRLAVQQGAGHLLRHPYPALRHTSPPRMRDSVRHYLRTRPGAIFPSSRLSSVRRYHVPRPHRPFWRQKSSLEYTLCFFLLLLQRVWCDILRMFTRVSCCCSGKSHWTWCPSCREALEPKLGFASR